MKKHGKKLEMFKVTETEDAEGFEFAYSYKELLTIMGGGRKIKMAKSNCTVLNEIYYQ